MFNRNGRASFARRRLSMTEVSNPQRVRHYHADTNKLHGRGPPVEWDGGAQGKGLSSQAYVIALYLKTPTTDAETAIQTDEAKRIVITMLRDVGRETFRSSD